MSGMRCAVSRSVGVGDLGVVVGSALAEKDEQLPVPLDPFERVGSPAFESELGPDDEVVNRTRYEHIPSISMGHHMGGDVHCSPATSLVRASISPVWIPARKSIWHKQPNLQK